MRNLIVIVLLFSVVACSQTAPVTSKILPKPQTEKITTQTTYTTTSYILAESLPNKKVKISITAKDKSLYIVNCNQFIVTSLFESSEFEQGNKNPVWGGVTDACLSENIIIPKGSTLSFDIVIDQPIKPIDFNRNYFVSVGGIYDNPNSSKSKPIATEEITSNEFKLIP